MAWTVPRTWVAGEVVTASIGNTHWRDNFKAIGDPWTSFAPVWRSGSGGTIVAIGNGSITGARLSIGKLVIFKIVIVRGSTTNLGTTGYVFELPVTAASFRMTGAAHVLDSNVSAVIPHAWHGLSTTEIVVHATGGNSGLRISNDGFGTTPTAWATSDEIVINGIYEAA